MKSCIEAVQCYFDARTQNWLYCDPALFSDVAQADAKPKWLQRSVRQAERKQRAYAAQGKRLCRVHTKVQILEIESSEDKFTATITALEQICWAYNDKQCPSVECRLIYHRLSWHYEQHTWVLTKAEETSDGKSFVEEPEYARVQEDLRLPVRKTSHGTYDRVRATRYADTWWDRFNPRYAVLSDDCTNFISQCLHAGGIPMTHVGNKKTGWWMTGQKGEAWSYSWTTSNALYRHLRSHVGAQLVQSPRDLKMGDLIFYDWNGSGAYHHSTIITDFDEQGDPLVNAHTDASFHRPYTYYDSRAWTERTRYAFVHIPDRRSIPSDV